LKRTRFLNRDLQSILSNFKLNTSSYNKLRLLEKEMLQEYGTLKYEKISSLKHSITMIEKKECKGPTKKYWYKIRVVIRSLHISPVEI